MNTDADDADTHSVLIDDDAEDGGESGGYSHKVRDDEQDSNL
jgi:hypothetical protein